MWKQVYKNCYQNEEHGDFDGFTEITKINEKRFHKHAPKNNLNTHSGFSERLILYFQKYSIDFKANMFLKSQFLSRNVLQFVYIK